MLEDEKDLVVSGEMDHVRVMSAAKYNERFRSIRSGMADRMKAIDRLRLRAMTGAGDEGR